MEKQYEVKYHEKEEKYWWFQARRDIILNLIKIVPRNSKILEIGCSGGLLLNALEKTGFYNLNGIDLSEKAIALCKTRGIQGVELADGQKTGFIDNSFDIIVASDVLEHIENEQKAISEWRRILKENGRLIVFVPAFQFLWSGHDEINHHYRRYSRKQLVALLENNRFKIQRASYWNFLLFFPISFIRIFQKIIFKNNEPKDQLREVNLSVNKILCNIVKLENKALIKGMNFPVGLSVFCVAKK